MIFDLSYVQPYVIALAAGAASGAIGSFIILRRMALVGDALSHVALPGIALALMYSIDPLWGVLVFLVLAAVLVWWLEGRIRIPTDALVGLLFTASLAVGILMIPDTEVLESLFGEFPALSPLIFVLVTGGSLGLGILSFILSRRFIFSITSPELAKIHAVGRMNDFFLLLIFSLIVALGIKLVGALLMGALTIIPASIAKNTVRSMRAYISLSAVWGGLISFAGVFLAETFHFLPGPSIILLGAVMFLLSLLFQRD